MQKIIVSIVLAIWSGLAWAQQNAVFSEAVVSIGDRKLTVEYASTFKQRSQGLMYRESMCEDCGMLFRFDHAKIASMWMKDTLIPLDVAFITSQGRIVDIKAMQPHNLTPVGSSEKVLYALEMNQGWFASQGIKQGQMVEFSFPEN